MAKGALIALRDTGPLSVDVSELVRRPGASMVLRTGSVVEGLSVPLARVHEGSALSLDLRLDALVDGIHVTGTIEEDLDLECRRCLADVHDHRSLPVSEVFVDAGDPRADQDAYLIEDERIDLEQLLRDVVVLSLPLDPLCRPDCKGLCATCGADRNQVDCGHDPEPIDIRWGPLRRLREGMEG